MRCACQRGTGSSLPLSSCVPADAYAMDASDARFVDSPTSTVPGSAADWMRAAVLTMSPATMPCPSAPMVTAASPVRTPARAASSGAPTSSPSVDTAATRSSAARTARSASSSVAVGVPHTAMTASPMNFSTVPPYSSISLPAGVEVAGEEFAHLLWVAALGERREADEVGEEDGDEPTLGRRPDGCWSGGRGHGAERASAFTAELYGRRVRGPTARAGLCERVAALTAELPSRLVLGAAGRAPNDVGHVFTLFRCSQALNRRGDAPRSAGRADRAFPGSEEIEFVLSFAKLKRAILLPTAWIPEMTQTGHRGFAARVNSFVLS